MGSNVGTRGGAETDHLVARQLKKEFPHHVRIACDTSYRRTAVLSYTRNYARVYELRDDQWAAWIDEGDRVVGFKSKDDAHKFASWYGRAAR